MSTFYEYDSSDLLAHYDIDEQPDAKSFGMHIHDRYEIYYFVEGEVNYLVEGREYLLEPDTIMIMRPGESHAAKILKEKTYKRCYINFHASLLDQIDPDHKMLRAFTDKKYLRQCTDITVANMINVAMSAFICFYYWTESVRFLIKEE